MTEDITEKSKDILHETWERIQKKDFKPKIADMKLIEAIHRIINSKTKSYRYVLPTQLIAKLADSSLDSKCLQVARGGSGAFDARSISKKVVVPFDRDNERVLGGSPEPYVNNPLRVPEVAEVYRTQQKDKQGWDDLIYVLGAIEEKNNPEYTLNVLEQVLLEIYERLSGLQVTYPVPRRISYIQTLEIIERFISIPSGGDTPLAVTAALFQIIKNKYGVYTNITRSKITAADESTGQVADIDCYEGENVLLSIEVKDRDVILDDLRDKLPACRSKRIENIIFITTKGIQQEFTEQIKDLIRDQYAVGLNIYILNFIKFIQHILPLFNEEARIEFIKEICNQLEKYGSTIALRQAWSKILSKL